MAYSPDPIDTSSVQISPEILELVELLAKNVHDIWADQRITQGWSYGDERSDPHKRHPGLVPYEELSEQEKDYDRSTAMETLKAILALGYRITKA